MRDLNVFLNKAISKLPEDYTPEMLKEQLLEENYDNLNKVIELIKSENLCIYSPSFLFNLLSVNNGVDINFLNKHPEIEWDYKHFSSNENVTPEVVMANLDKNWCFKTLSSNSNFPLSFIISNPQFAWDDGFLSMNNSLSWSEICENPKRKWLYNKLSGLDCITLDIIRANPDKDWCLKTFMKKNKNCNWNVVLSNPDIEWDYQYLSLNDNIQWDVVEANLDKNWIYYVFLQKTSITPDILRRHSARFIRFMDPLFANPNFTCNQVVQLILEIKVNDEEEFIDVYLIRCLNSFVRNKNLIMDYDPNLNLI